MNCVWGLNFNPTICNNLWVRQIFYSFNSYNTFLILINSRGGEEKNNAKWVFVLTITLLILSPLCFWSSDVSAASGIVHLTLYPTADAYVNSSSSATNYGSASVLNVSANAELDFVYVRFNLTSVPLDVDILSANLSLFLVNTNGISTIPPDIIGAYYCSDNSWTEAGFNWNNKPTSNLTPTRAMVLSPSTPIDAYKSWAVTEDVIAAVPSGNLTEVFKFWSKEGNG